MSSELSWWYPDQTVCVLVAAGLESEQASRFGFCPIRNGIAAVQDLTTRTAPDAGAHNSAGVTLTGG
jgi:hypothetical protein